MIRIAIVDDDDRYRAEVKEYIECFSKEADEEFDVTMFGSGMDFITDYKPIYDIVFLDIEMPLMDGMTTARRLRRLDTKICIVFITRMSKYAIEGYEVNAVDFVVKPIKYFNFVDKLKKAMGYVRSHHEKELVIKSDDNYFRLPISQINYIAKDKNYLVYNTERGDIRERGTMEAMEKQLRGDGFSLCNSGCLVNLRRLQQVTQSVVVVGGVSLPLSRRRIKSFKQDMLEYLRGDSQ